MRVIAGVARSLRLKSIDGDSTRPTTDKIKETLFNILSPYLNDGDFLDLYAGSGAIGIEALSRSMCNSVFIEKNPKCIKCINDNLKFTKLESRAEVIHSDVMSALKTLEKNNHKFGIVFLDPPYNNNFERNVLEFLEHSNIIDEDTIIVVEASVETDFSYLDNMDYNIFKEKVYGSNKHLFLSR